MQIDTNDNSKRLYLRIRQGKLMKPVKNYDGKDSRVTPYTYTDKKTGETITAYGIFYRPVENQKITGLRYRETEYGDQFMIDFDTPEEEVTVTVPVQSKEFRSFAEKLLSLDVEKPVSFGAFYFEEDKKANKRAKAGAWFTQDETPVKSKFYSEEGTKKHGYPEINEQEKEELGKDYWSIYFKKVDAFLKNSLRKLADEKFMSSYKQVDTSNLDIEEIPYKEEPTQQPSEKPKRKAPINKFDNTPLPEGVTLDDLPF